MQTSLLYKTLVSASLPEYRSRFFGRRLHVLPYAEFQKYEEYFSPSPNIFNTKNNYRSHSGFRHIHAVRTDNLVEFHYDYGNLDQNILYAPLHAVLDVIPYFIHFLLVWRKPYMPKRRSEAQFRSA